MTLSLLRRPKGRYISMDESTWPVDANGVPLFLGLLSRADLDGIKEIGEQQERLVGGRHVGFQDSDLVGVGDGDERVSVAPLCDLAPDGVARHLKAKFLVESFAKRHGRLLRRGGRS